MSGPLAIEWVGAASFRIDHGGGSLWFDPWVIDNPGSPFASLEDAPRPSAVVVTHGHPGHFGKGDSVAVAKRSDAPYVAPTSLVEYVVEEMGVCPELAVGVEPGVETVVDGVAIAPFAVDHPPVRHEFTVDGPPSEPNLGYVARVDGAVVLHVGDTGPDAQYERMRAERPVDVAFLPLWAKEMVWDEEEALAAFLGVVEQLRPRFAVPHARYRADVATPARAVEEVRRRGLATTVVPMRPGDRLLLVG